MIKRLIPVVAAVLIISACVAGDQPAANSILVIQPYRHAGTWVFDDNQAGLKKEPFIAGAPEILDKMVADIPNAEKGFRLLFSAQEFPGAHKFLLRRPDKGGNWYYSAEYKMEGWLCPSLFKYIRPAPRTLYAKAEPLKTKHESTGQKESQQAAGADEVPSAQP